MWGKQVTVFALWGQGLVWAAVISWIITVVLLAKRTAEVTEVRTLDAKKNRFRNAHKRGFTG